MGRIPPERPNRPQWMDDATWHVIIGHELRRMERFERENRESCFRMVWTLLVLLSIGLAVLCLP